MSKTKPIDVYAHLEKDDSYHTGWVIAFTSKKYFDRVHEFDDSTGDDFDEIPERLNRTDVFICEEDDDNTAEVQPDGILDGRLSPEAVRQALAAGVNLITDCKEFNDYCARELAKQNQGG